MLLFVIYVEWYLPFDTLTIIRRGWNEANNPRDHDSLSRYTRREREAEFEISIDLVDYSG